LIRKDTSKRGREAGGDGMEMYANKTTVNLQFTGGGEMLNKQIKQVLLFAC